MSKDIKNPISETKRLSSVLRRFRNMMPQNRRGWTILAIIVVVVAAVALWISLRPGGGQAVLSPQSQIQNQFLERLPELQRNIAEDPNNPGLQQELGVAKYATGDLQGAQSAYERTVELDPQNAVAHNNLGNTNRDLGDYAKAESEYRLAMKLDPKLTTPYMNLASIYQYILGKPETAIQIYEDGIKSNPDYVDFYTAIAAVYEQQGLKDKAIAMYKQALEIQPESPAATAGLRRLGQ